MRCRRDGRGAGKRHRCGPLAERPRARRARCNPGTACPPESGPAPRQAADRVPAAARSGRRHRPCRSRTVANRGASPSRRDRGSGAGRGRGRRKCRCRRGCQARRVRLVRASKRRSCMVGLQSDFGVCVRAQPAQRAATACSVATGVSPRCRRGIGPASAGYRLSRRRRSTPARRVRHSTASDCCGVTANLCGCSCRGQKVPRPTTKVAQLHSPRVGRLCQPRSQVRCLVEIRPCDGGLLAHVAKNCDLGLRGDQRVGDSINPDSGAPAVAALLAGDLLEREDAVSPAQTCRSPKPPCGSPTPRGHLDTVHRPQSAGDCNRCADSGPPRHFAAYDCQRGPACARRSGPVRPARGSARDASRSREGAVERHAAHAQAMSRPYAASGGRRPDRTVICRPAPDTMTYLAACCRRHRRRRVRRVEPSGRRATSRRDNGPADRSWPTRWWSRTATYCRSDRTDGHRYRSTAPPLPGTSTSRAEIHFSRSLLIA